MKKEKIYPTYVLYTNEIEVTEEELERYNKENETDYKDVYELSRVLEEQETEDFYDNLRYCGYNDDKFVIFGTLGLWNGNHTICPLVFDGLKEVIMKAIEKSDYVKIIVKNGAINVTATHHDGTNCFSIKKLNERGINCKNGDLSKTIYHERIKGYLW